MLFGKEPSVSQPQPGIPPTTPTTPPAVTPLPAKTVERANATFEVFTQTLGAVLTCQTIGKPELLIGSRFTPTDNRSVLFPEQTFAAGLGAFGSNFAECQDRFGEFLAVAGATAYLPADG